MGHIRQSDKIENFANFPPKARSVKPIKSANKHQIVAPGHLLVKGEVLRDHPQPGTAYPRVLRKGYAIDFNGARIGLNQSTKCRKGARFAGTVGAQKRKRLPPLQSQGKPADRMQMAVAHMQVVHFQGISVRHGHSFLPKKRDSFPRIIGVPDEIQARNLTPCNTGKDGQNRTVFA